MLEDPDSTDGCGLIIQHEANLDDSECSCTDEGVAEQRVDLASEVDCKETATLRLFTFDEIIRACSWALMPHPVMIILVSVIHR